MKLKVSFFSVAFLLCSIFNIAYGQNFSVKGKVQAKSTGQALFGATVSVAGTTNATTTDELGNFSIEVPKKGSILVVSYTGMKAVRYNFTQNSGSIIILMESSANETLNDVIVIGYGSQKITKVSGAISTVKSGEIEKLNPTRAEEALQGRASGVTVIDGGSLGTKPTIFLRGIPSNAGSDPLVVIDGVQQTLDNFNSINPLDIESINVLKDAASTAIYGVKGGNGVIVVTTKSGKRNQKTRISFSSNYGSQQVLKTIGVLNATEYAAIINEGSTTSGGGVIFPNLSSLGMGTNWQDQIFKTAPIQSYNLSVTGGEERMSYYLSGGYFSQGGIVGGYDKSRFNRGNFTANLNFDITKKLKFIFNTTGVSLQGKSVAENSFNSLIGSALNYDPTVPILNTTGNVGKYGYSNLILSEVFNPLTQLDNTYNKNNGTTIYGKFELQYELFKNLKLTTRYGYLKYDDVSKSFNPLVFYGVNNINNTMNADGSTVSGQHNSVSNSKSGNFNWNWESFANYDFRINTNHHFETVVGFSLQKGTGNAAGTTRQDVPFNSWDYADYTAATGVNTATNTNASTGYYYEYFNKHESMFGRINYDYKEKYLASFSARRDGSYAFGTNNKFGNFYAGSLGWVVTKEDFFKSEFINFLKIRGSYGSVGSDANTSPQYVSILTGGPSYAYPVNSNGYNFSNVFYPGATVNSTVNNALSWERDVQGNIGFDMNFYKNKFTLNADYFQKNVNGLLFTPAASLYLGTSAIPLANIGSTKTTGFDATFGFNSKIGKSFRINTSATFTHFKSLVTKTNDDGTAYILGGYFFNGQSQPSTIFEKGQAPGAFYGYKTNGLFQTVADIKAAAPQAGAQPGDIRFVDVNGDGKIDANDKTIIGNPFPKFTIGWSLNLEYRNFDFTAFTYFSEGNDIYRAYERNANYTNKNRNILARWTGSNSTNDAANPRYSFTDANNNARVSQRYLEDGSFIKIKNIQLGYSFPESITKKMFSKIRIYAQVKNAFTFTKYSGYDPEISGGIMGSGVDLGAYPQARSYAVGLDIKL